MKEEEEERNPSPGSAGGLGRVGGNFVCAPGGEGWRWPAGRPADGEGGGEVAGMAGASPGDEGERDPGRPPGAFPRFLPGPSPSSPSSAAGGTRRGLEAAAGRSGCRPSREAAAGRGGPGRCGGRWVRLLRRGPLGARGGVRWRQPPRRRRPPPPSFSGGRLRAPPAGWGGRSPVRGGGGSLTAARPVAGLGLPPPPNPRRAAGYPP